MYMYKDMVCGGECIYMQYLCEGVYKGGLPGFLDLAGNVCIWMLAKGLRMVAVGEVVDVVLRGREGRRE